MREGALIKKDQGMKVLRERIYKEKYALTVKSKSKKFNGRKTQRMVN
jgi:hypothetical protein